MAFEVTAAETGIAIGIDPRPAKVGAQQVNQALDTVSARAQATVQRVQNVDGAFARLTASLRTQRGIVQQFGFQFSDLATQIASGQSAIVAFTQQGSQILQVFGPAGAILGALAAAAGAVAVGFLGSADGMGEAEKAAKDYERALSTLHRVMLATTDAAKVKEEADRKEAAGILAKTAALKQETVAQKEASLARVQALIENENLTRGRIRSALDQSLGNNATGAGPGQDALAKLKADLFTAREDARELQEQIDALNSAVNLSEIFAGGDAVIEYRQNLERALAIAKMGTEEGKIQADIDRMRVTLGKALTPELEKNLTLLIRQVHAAEAARKADEDRVKFTQRIIDMLDSDAAKAVEQANRRNAGVEKYIDSLENAAKAAALSTTEQKVQTALFEAQNRLIDEQGKKLRDLTDDERARIEAAVRTKDAIDEQTKAYEKQAREIERVTDRATKNAADILYDAFTGKIRSVGDFLKTTILRAAADISAQLVFRPIIAPIVGSVLGGGAGAAAGTVAAGGAGAAGGLIGNLGLGDVIGSVGGYLAGGMQFVKDTIYQAASFIDPTGALGVDLLTGGGLLYGSLGGIAAKLLGLGSGNFLVDTGLGLGGTVLGALLGGPIGAGIGGFLGTALGGLFGGNKGFSGGQINIGVDQSGRLIPTEAGFKRFNDVAGAMAAAQQFADQMNALFGQLGLSVAPGGNITNLGFGQGAAGIEWSVGQLIRSGRIRSGFTELDMAIRNLSTAGTADEITARLADLVQTFNIIKNIDFDPEELTQVEQVMKAINEQFDQLKIKAQEYGLSIAGLEQARADAFERLRQGFEQSIEDQILAITDPLELALRQLERAQEQRLREAKAAGADLVQVEKLAALERQKVIEQFSGQATKSLRDLLNSLLGGSASPLSPAEILANAESRFNEVRAAALGGDASALAALPQAATDLLNASRTMFASSEMFFERFNFVTETLRNLIGDAPGFATGGSFTVGGVGGIDSQFVRFRATPGERVRVSNAHNDNDMNSQLFRNGRQMARDMALLIEEVRGLRREVRDQKAVIARQQMAIDRLTTAVPVSRSAAR